jgi:signal transduction histidine kinase
MAAARPHPVWRDRYIAAVMFAAGGLFAFSATHPTSSDLWNAWGALVLFGAMALAERLSVFVPRDAKVSVATIPHIVAVLLLPPWLAMALAGGAMLADQVTGRATWRKMAFNVASIILTVGVTAVLADIVRLDRDALGQPAEWQQIPAFLLVAATYYGMTNGLTAIVMSLDGGEPVWRIFLDTTSFTLPAEFAVCGIGGLVAVLWVLSPAWAPVILFPVVVSQAALSYISSSKRSHARLVFLAEASRVLGLSLDQDELPGRVAQLAVPMLGDTCLTYLLADDGALRQAACVRGAAHSSGEPAPGASATGPILDLTPWVRRMLARGRTVLLPELRRDDHRAMPPEADQHRALSQLGVQSLMSVPLLASGHLLGALVFLNSYRRYEADDLALAEDLARRCAVAFDNARLHAEAQRASRLRDEFLSVAAHELKTPVTSLRGYAQLLARMLENDERPDPGLLAKGFRAIDTQSEKLGRLTHQLLDVSRIESGKLQLERRNVDVSALVRSVAAAVQAGTGHHVVRVRVPDACVAAVDPLRLEQVVSNLLSNAVKYSPAGGPIDVRLEHIGPAALSLEVRDWGVGIPPERRGQLFDRFYQAHGEGHFGGLGLGLYISRQIVELHGGRITADFPADGGTCFRTEIPVGSVEPPDGPTDSATRSQERLAQTAAADRKRLDAPHESVYQQSWKSWGRRPAVLTP